ncbi:MAG: tRNA pseudouridine(55) synthase TruB [Candidatus Omnitrophica bacterium]|nr:tRNA pseudouridine(55) synthase TruB [Candidatus Omnitrophota bacterium]
MDISGLLLVDKPLDMSSHDVVDILRRKLDIKKIGHAGTLDPQATGLLLMLISRQATKRAQLFSGMDKSYQARLTLGIKTDTADHTGNVVEQFKVPEFSLSDIEKAFSCFQGKIMQTPPMVSAKKINGQKLYSLARKGITVARNPVEITIGEIKILAINLPHIDFQVKCSKGTYIRTLCEDIGQKLGCNAHMNGLRRTSIGQYNVDNAITVDKIKQADINDIAQEVIKI